MSRKNKQIFFQVYRRFKRKQRNLSEEVKQQFRGCLKNLETALLASDKDAETRYATQAKGLYSRYLNKTSFEQIKDLVFALAFALVVAIVIRQVWFELYEIPTGSMRPTLKEQDRLLVSKTTFGINYPIKAEHLYFEPELVQRNGIVTFTSDKMDIADADTRYFYIFPGKKQFVKRLLGKPGDLLYFYGGQIYGFDAKGNDISHELQIPQLKLIDHIPFLRFEGQLSYPSQAIGGVYPSAVVHQMGEPIAILNGAQGGKLLDLSAFHDNTFPTPNEYGKLWGIDNFAMTRLLTKEEAIVAGASSAQEATLYLELFHHPRLDCLELVRDTYGRLRPGFLYETSLVPLAIADIETLFSHLYTARFKVKNSMVTRYSISSEPMPNQLVPRLPDVPDGTYEFYYGKAYKIGWTGVATELPHDHPLYLQTPERLLLWFNLGLDFNNLYKPSSRSSLLPNRYAYFRDGDFYVMGQPLWEKDNASLKAFEASENSRITTKNYVPFVDAGPPTKEMIEECGLKIPSNKYLVLGDNHAMSGDSRIFGFVPAGNLRGAPSLIFWPYGENWGTPNQPPYAWVTLPNAIIWILFIIILVIWNMIHRRRTQLPVKDL